jgi:His/Glu/Gln/Arg/opine family amino acid ABC transporter permease subunit
VELRVITDNFAFLILQGFFGFGAFAGGTLRLAVPAIVLGFLLGIFIGLGRLARSRWISVPTTIYVEFFRGVPLVMVIFWFWFIIPVLVENPCRIRVALTAFVSSKPPTWARSSGRGYNRFTVGRSKPPPPPD